MWVQYYHWGCCKMYNEPCIPYFVAKYSLCPLSMISISIPNFIKNGLVVKWFRHKSLDNKQTDFHVYNIKIGMSDYKSNSSTLKSVTNTCNIKLIKNVLLFSLFFSWTDSVTNLLF